VEVPPTTVDTRQVAGSAALAATFAVTGAPGNTVSVTGMAVADVIAALVNREI
jgi:hypothetical protein